jgi:nucleoid DNA-binding protein
MIKKNKRKEEEELFDFDELPPDIGEHLKESSDNLLISFNKDDELISKVTSETGLKNYAAKLILQNIFQEIRNEVLDGGEVFIKHFGVFDLNKSNRPKFRHFSILKKIIKEYE